MYNLNWIYLSGSHTKKHFHKYHFQRVMYKIGLFIMSILKIWILDYLNNNQSFRDDTQITSPV